jgi:uncharacterized protein YjiS (DUF1127 family)
MGATLSWQPSLAALRLRAGRHEQALKPVGYAARVRAALGSALVRLVKGILSWDARIRDRQLLARLDDRALRDIGIDRAAVDDDSATGFWRLR